MLPSNIPLLGVGLPSPVRPRLIGRLNERVHVSAGRTPGMTLISAPAGIGKTTLASVWSHDLRLLLN